MNLVKQLQERGQAVWLDYIRRSLITSGALQRLIEEDGLSGVTSNPTIFEKAIDGSGDYDEDLRKLLADCYPDLRHTFDELATDDIRMAADLLRPVWDARDGDDGYVSIEVSPDLARDTAGTIAEAQRLWKKVGRPNVMIKVPATREGIPAIETLIGEGINVNVTLMFSMAHYEAVANAYLRGLRSAADPTRVASVASFFVSRVDTEVDKALETIGTPEALNLRGKIAIANARLVYQRFQSIFHGGEFAEQRKRGARVQRPLWASTGTKNLAYSDVLYVEELIGKDTVNTMPPATLDAFRNHGQVRGDTVDANAERAAADLAQLARLEIDLGAITATLQDDGVAAFADSYQKLLTVLAKKRTTLVERRVERQSMSLGPHHDAVRQRVSTWRAADFGCRLWRKDYSLWTQRPVPELTDRMGWLNLPATMREQISDLRTFANDVKDDGFTDIVLLGMGGSSLAPEVLQHTFGNAAGYPRLTVLDCTHPDAIRGVEHSIDLKRSLFLVSSKSGTTTETLSFFHYFWAKLAKRRKNPGSHFVAITDPGTPLERLAREHKFRHAFLPPADVGGRYSALTAFGLVPAALIGVNLDKLQSSAQNMAEACAFCVPESDSPCLQLGAALGELARAGRDKLTFFASPSLSSLPAWLEQLVAESTGKDSKGIVPVADEPLGRVETYGDDRVFVFLELVGEDAGSTDKTREALETAGRPIIRIRLHDKHDLAAEFYRWEIAVAAAGAVLGIHPFDQPDVELAKQLAREAMQQQQAGAVDREDTRGGDLIAVEHSEQLKHSLHNLLTEASANDYIALQAYLAPTPATTAALQNIRLLLRDKSRLATTLGYGPRFLHSTGQLHKGGPSGGLFLQLLDEPARDLAVPESAYTFGELIRAQALGDYHALQLKGRKVVRVNLGKKPADGLQQLKEILQWPESQRSSGISAA